MNRRDQLIEVFEDTRDFYTDSPGLSEAAENSRRLARLYEEDAYPELPRKRYAPGVVRVTRHKTFEAAMLRHAKRPDERIAVLNFASAVNPGGGVRNGSSAQEESLCRCSTLYPTLNQSAFWKRYYEVNRAANDPVHTDACIWSPGVVICKTDESIPRRMRPKDWVTVDVITCAAPNLRERTGNIHNPETAQAIRLSPDEQYSIHLKRAKHILHIAAVNKVDALILGAFGCGAFANDPWAVARAYQDALKDYLDYFSYVEFAIYCRPHETVNYDAFRKTLVES